MGRDVSHSVSGHEQTLFCGLPRHLPPTSTLQARAKFPPCPRPRGERVDQSKARRRVQAADRAVLEADYAVAQQLVNDGLFALEPPQASLTTL